MRRYVDFDFGHTPLPTTIAQMTDQRTWHTFNAEWVANELATDTNTGLTNGEATRRLGIHGVNDVEAEKLRGPIQMLLAQSAQNEPGRKENTIRLQGH